MSKRVQLSLELNQLKRQPSENMINFIRFFYKFMSMTDSIDHSINLWPILLISSIQYIFMRSP